MKIVLVTMHAKYIHASLALPCLAAATPGIDGVETVIRECTVNEPYGAVLRTLVDECADVVAFSCYIWNVERTARIASDLKKLNPSLFIAVGGPEVSHTAEEFLRENEAFDGVIRGEGEETWSELVWSLARSGTPTVRAEALPAGITVRTGDGIVSSPDREPMENLDAIPSPFAMGLVDLKKPLVYYETSRGCPFACAFCLSSLEKGVRSFSPERIHADLSLLMERSVRQVKLVDRTFNYDAVRADEIWKFILTRNRSSCFHFEIAADLLTDSNLRTLGKVPEGMFRFEIGVQATGRETLERVGRKSDTERLFANVRRLTKETGVTVHLDLVAGLPGENYPGFLGSLQRLFPLGPHHIQVEPLKVLKGSPMADIARREKYVFSSRPPYTILRTPDLSFKDIGRIEEISRLVDLFHNSGRFIRSLQVAGRLRLLSVFFEEMSRFMEKEAEGERISLKGLFDLLWRFAQGYFSRDEVGSFRDALRYDFCMVEYPSAGALPTFFRDDRDALREKTPKEIIDSVLGRVVIPAGSRVRTFSARFLNNYSVMPPAEGPVTLVFVYVSAPGDGLGVSVFPLSSLSDTFPSAME
jgi:anaerobic magnesium-protoporphyrin IX monomethyl ester cyclase